jgi:hypothetical protein
MTHTIEAGEALNRLIAEHGLAAVLAGLHNEIRGMAEERDREGNTDKAAVLDVVADYVSQARDVEAGAC